MPSAGRRAVMGMKSTFSDSSESESVCNLCALPAAAPPHHRQLVLALYHKAVIDVAGGRVAFELGTVTARTPMWPALRLPLTVCAVGAGCTSNRRLEPPPCIERARAHFTSVAVASVLTVRSCSADVQHKKNCFQNRDCQRGPPRKKWAFYCNAVARIEMGLTPTAFDRANIQLTSQSRPPC
eukprot:scaffold14000_cov135-Isochrysis_galbana.AAC.4